MTATLFGGVEVLCRHLTMIYDIEGETVVALDDINLDVQPGEQVAVIGPSGSGKSTLTTLLAGLRRPKSGNILIGTEDLAGLTERDLLRLRSQRIGIVLQNPSRSLLPYGTAEDNIRFAQRAVPRNRRSELPAPGALLEQLGLGALRGSRAGSLSGGEQQRLAVAVGMANAPSLLLADEPTSQLDQHSRDVVVELIKTVAGQFGTTAVVVTHDQVVADAMDRALTMHEGQLVSDGRRNDRTDVGRSVLVGEGGRIELAGLDPDLFPVGSTVRVRPLPRGVMVVPAHLDDMGAVDEQGWEPADEATAAVGATEWSEPSEPSVGAAEPSEPSEPSVGAAEPSESSALDESGRLAEDHPHAAGPPRAEDRSSAEEPPDDEPYRAWRR